MGASSSVNTREFNGHRSNYDDEEYKDANELYLNQSFTDEKQEHHSLLWFTINSIMDAVYVVKSDFQYKNNITIKEVMTKIMINIDSIHNIQGNSFEYGKIQPIDKKKINLAKLILKKYYEMSCVIIIDNPLIYKPIDLSLFTYGVFEFLVDDHKLHVYI